MMNTTKMKKIVKKFKTKIKIRISIISTFQKNIKKRITIKHQTLHTMMIKRKMKKFKAIWIK